MKEASIIIPTYNELENIRKLIPDVERVLSAHKILGEIIIIDDNSPDGTGQLAEELKKRYKNIVVIHRKAKLGVGSARKVGFAKASKNIIISMEGDMTHNPEYLPQFVEKIGQGYDLVIGSRYVDGAKILNWPLKRRIVSKVANGMARFLSGTKLNDVTSGYRAFKKELLGRLFIESYSYPFNMEFACEASSRGFKVAEIPITFIHRKEGKSKLNIVKELFAFLYIAFKFSYTYRPMYVFGGVGLLLLLLGFILGMNVVYLKVTGQIEKRLTLVFLTVLLLISGIQMLAIGLIAKMIANFRREVV